jgi:hypothetical protein
MQISNYQYWLNSLTAQWASRRELQKNGFKLKEADPKLVREVADVLVYNCLKQLQEIKKNGSK